MSRTARLAPLIAVALLGAGAAAYAENGAFRSTAHGDRTSGPQRRADRERGSCLQCHESHASHGGGKSHSAAFGLFAPAAEVCVFCHQGRSGRSGFPTLATWLNSAHALMPPSVVPFSRSMGDPNRCAVCHDPHGIRDKEGVIPSVLRSRQPDLCLACHDGLRAADIRGELQKQHAHARYARGTHHATEDGDPARYSALAQNRHAVCADCHNPHAARSSESGRTLAPEASMPLLSVSRVQVRNGAAGSQPAYTWLPEADPSPTNEYEICFKCHSSWTQQSPGQQDLARSTNPENPSFHPIQQAGKNRRIDPNAFTNGIFADSIIRCTDCHSSDSEWISGPHGSSHAHLLKKPVPLDGDPRAMAEGDLCFDCHEWTVYGDPTANPAVRGASRFAEPSGHVFHVGFQKIACRACHEPHGSTRHPALISTTARPGITTYLQTPGGGSCAPTCHVMKSYTVSYPR